MPTYISQGYLAKDGKVYQPGEKIDLTEDNASRLGELVATSAEYEYSQKTLSDLKEIAKGKGLQGISNLNKEDLIKALVAADQQPVAPSTGETQTNVTTQTASTQSATQTPEAPKA